MFPKFTDVPLLRNSGMRQKTYRQSRQFCKKLTNLGKRSGGGAYYYYYMQWFVAAIDTIRG